MNDANIDNIGDLTASQILSADWLRLRVNPGSLPNHPALWYQGSVRGRGGNVLKVPHSELGGGYRSLAGVGDGQAIQNTAISDNSTLITVTRQGLSREVSDMAEMVRPDMLSKGELAKDGFDAYVARQTDMICDVIDGFTAVEDCSGTVTQAHILAMLGTVRGQFGIGPYMAVLHTKQMSEWEINIGTGTGGLAFIKESTDMIGLKGGAYQGFYLGADWFSTPRVVLDAGGTNRMGGVFGRGAVLWADGEFTADDPVNQMMIGKLLFERDRNAPAGTKRWISSTPLGFSKGLEFGVTLKSTA